MPKTGESGADRQGRVIAKAHRDMARIRETSPDSETKDQMKAREAQRGRVSMGDGGRQLLDPSVVGDLRATGIPPGMEDQIGAAEVQASPEEEAQLEQAATKIRRMIHGRKSRDYVVDMLNDRNVPVPQAVGRVAAQMVETIKEQASAGKVELDDELLMNVGVITAKELLDVGIAGGFYPLEEDTPEYDEALQQAVLEGVKAHGERVLASPKGAKLSEEAGSVWAQKVAEEVDAGTADPEYLAMARGGEPQQRQLVEA